MFTRRLPKAEVKKLDIGCKTLKKAGFIGLDILDFGQEIVWDLREGIPVPDGTVQEIYCSHLLEHLEPKDIQPFFIELYRILIPGGVIEFRVPDASTIESYYACHLTRWNIERFKGIIKGLDAGYRFTLIETGKEGIELWLRIKKS